MPGVIINGQQAEFADGTTILAACNRLGIEIPTLCHDERLKPTGACRLCAVEVKGWNRFPTACNTAVLEGMEILTHSAEVEKMRGTLLRLLAEEYPPEAVGRSPDKPFHQWLRHYEAEGGRRLLSSQSYEPPGLVELARGAPFKDGSHPYIEADFSRCITCFRCLRICEEVQGQFVWQAWNRGDQTRIWPANGDTMTGAGCVGCGACVDSCPTGALEDRSILEAGLPVHWTRTTCPYCGVGCEMNVGTRDGRIIQVKPVINSPVSKGHLCIKGRYAFDFTHAWDRVTEPMIRRGGDWEKVSWSKAIAYVAERFAQMAKTHGPDSVGVLGSARGTNEENYVAQKFARVVLGTNNVDCCARVCHAPTAAGMKQMLGTGAATNSFDDIEMAHTFLVCGCNPTENHPIVGARIKQAVLRGARLIVIDPRQIELARMADVHLAVRPGTNVALLNAIAHVAVVEGLVDERTLRERVSGYDAFRDFISEWIPERAAAITGVSPDLIREAARLYATGGPAMCFHGLGMTEHVQGTEGVMCLVNLALITGNFGRPGSGVNPLRGQNNVQGAAHMGCEPRVLTGSVPLDQGREVFEAAWQAPVPLQPGMNLMEMLDAAAAQRLKGLWAIGYDVAMTNPDHNRTRKALGELEFLVVQDLFMNETAREFGEVFLPACSSFEKEGTFMNSERRIQRVRKVLEPVGHSRADWEILCAVATEMGFGGQFDFHTPEEIWNEVRKVWKAGAGISYARIEHSGLQWPCPSADHPGTTTLHVDTFPAGPKAPLKCIGFHASDEMTTEDMPFLLTTGRTLYQFNSGTMTMRTSNAKLRPADTVDMAPADAIALGLVDGDNVCVRSRHGEAVLQLRVDPRIQRGGLFATFHSPEVLLNRVTGKERDAFEQTPEYKVVAVNVEKMR